MKDNYTLRANIIKTNYLCPICEEMRGYEIGSETDKFIDAIYELYRAAQPEQVYDYFSGDECGWSINETRLRDARNKIKPFIENHLE